MDAFQAFKFYTAIKLHFTNDNFDVFQNRGHVKGSFSTFQARRDRGLFEKLARQYSASEFIKYIASNFMYHNPNVIYDTPQGESNYKEFIKRRQSMTRVFENDVDYIENTACFSPTDILQSYVANKITLESAVILDKLTNWVSKLKEESPTITQLMEDDLLLVTKSHGFVKFDPLKIQRIYKENVGIR